MVRGFSGCRQRGFSLISFVFFLSDFSDFKSVFIRVPLADQRNPRAISISFKPFFYFHELFG